MKSISEASVRAELQARIAKLTPDKRPAWGRFNAGQMLRHCSMPMLGAMGKMEVAEKPTPFFFKTGLMRWLIIYSPVPWPKGVPTAPEFIPPAATDFQDASKSLAAVLGEFAGKGASMRLRPHPAFGELSFRDWTCLQWRHIDHHLRQFGV